MNRYLHFTDNFNNFEPTADPDKAPDISILYGGLFVYRFPESNEAFNTLWKAWGYRDAVEILSPTEATFVQDDPVGNNDEFAEFVIPFSEFCNLRYYRVDC